MRRGAPAALLLLVVLAGCGKSSVSAGQVEREVADHVRETTGTKIAVTCPHGLDLKPGTRVTCTSRGQQLVVEVVDDKGGLAIRDLR